MPKPVTNQKQVDAPAPGKTKRKTIDWARIEPGWRANVKSVLQLAADYEAATGDKVSHTAINKHFKDLNIPRDLREKVKASAQAKVSAAVVSAQVSTETTPNDAAIIEANADLVAGVMLSQRKDIQRSRHLAMSLLYELEDQTFSRELFDQLADLVAGPPITGTEPADKAAEARRQRLLEAFDRVMSTGSRVDSMKKLADTLKTLVALEREAYGLADDPSKPKGAGTLEDWLDSLD
jgi:hypothetical protein